MSSDDRETLSPPLVSQNENSNSSVTAPPETDLQFLLDQNLGIGNHIAHEDSSHLSPENSMEITPISTPKRIVKRKKTIPQSPSLEESTMEDSPAKNLRRRRSLYTTKPVNYNEESDHNGTSTADEKEEENEKMMTSPKSRGRRRKSDGEKPSPNKKFKFTPTKEWKEKQEEEIQKMKDYFKHVDSIKLKSGNEVNNDNEFAYL